MRGYLLLIRTNDSIARPAVVEFKQTHPPPRRDPDIATPEYTILPGVSKSELTRHPPVRRQRMAMATRGYNGRLHRHFEHRARNTTSAVLLFLNMFAVNQPV